MYASLRQPAIPVILSTVLLRTTYYVQSWYVQAEVSLYVKQIQMFVTVQDLVEKTQTKRQYEINPQFDLRHLRCNRNS